MSTPTTPPSTIAFRPPERMGELLAAIAERTGLSAGELTKQLAICALCEIPISHRAKVHDIGMWLNPGRLTVSFWNGAIAATSYFPGLLQAMSELHEGKGDFADPGDNAGRIELLHEVMRSSHEERDRIRATLLAMAGSPTGKVEIQVPAPMGPKPKAKPKKKTTAKKRGATKAPARYQR